MPGTDASRPLYSVSSAPLWHCGRSQHKTMALSLVLLLPAALLAVYHYGLPALSVIAWSGLTAVLTEAGIYKLMKKTPPSDDFSALLDGILLAFLLPATTPLWLVISGSVAMMVLGRMVFGGYGGSPVCAPAVGWSVLTISWPHLMDHNSMLLFWNRIEPLAELKFFGPQAITDVSLWDLLSGNILGPLGASQAGLILCAGAVLLLRKELRWHIPVSFLLGVLLTASLYTLIDPELYASPLVHLFSGSMLLAAFFLMPYPSSAPCWPIPMLIYGFFGGVLAMIIRIYGIYPDGVPFAVLLVNLCTPLLDLIEPKPFGGR